MKSQIQQISIVTIWSAKFSTSTLNKLKAKCHYNCFWFRRFHGLSVAYFWNLNILKFSESNYLKLWPYFKIYFLFGNLLISLQEYASSLRFTTRFNLAVDLQTSVFSLEPHPGTKVMSQKNCTPRSNWPLIVI